MILSPKAINDTMIQVISRSDELFVEDNAYFKNSK